MKYGLLKAFALGCVFPLTIALNACDDDSSTSSPAEQLSTEVDQAKPGSESTKSSSSTKAGGSSSSSEKSNNAAKSSSSNSKGTYSPCLNTSVSYGKVTDSRDGQVYRTVTIGTQIWMAENLNYAAYVDVPISLNDEGPYKSDSSSWCYDNDPVNCEKYGRLFTWGVAMDSAARYSTTGKGCGYDGGNMCTTSGFVRGICPSGWHLPSAEEWNRLLVAVGSRPKIVGGLPMAYNIGSKLKSSCGWDEDGNGTDDFGFSANPAGFAKTGYFHNLGQNVYFWSSDANGYVYGISWKLSKSYDRMDATNSLKFYGHYVRCMRDEVNLPESMSLCGVKKDSWVYLNPNIDYGCMTDNRDGQVYATVSIGSQIWMAENLNYEPRDGWSACYNNTARYCDVYGRLYSFAAAMDSVNQGGCGRGVDCTPNIPHRGICPDGWHIPTRTEFDTLLSTVGIDDSTRSVGLRSKAWMLGLDDYGFSAAPTGHAYICGEDESFSSLDEITDFWSVDGSLYIKDYSAKWTNGNGRCYPRSVRCIKD